MRPGTGTSTRAADDLRRSYRLALGLIGLALLAGLVLSQRAMRGETRQARIVDQAGRQRMLSQRIVLLTGGLRTTPPDASASPAADPADRVAVERCLRRLTAVHAALLRDARAGAHTSGLARHLERATPAMAEFRDEVERVLAGDGDHARVRILADDLLLRMDAAVAEMVHVAAERRTTHLQLEFGLVLTQLVGLLAVMLGILRPASKRLGRLVETVRKQAWAERTSAAKDSFLRNISHEMRTPLQAIQGYAELLAGSEDDDEQKASREALIRSSRQLEHLIDNILDLATIDSETREPLLVRMDPREIARTAIETHARTARMRGLSIGVECRGSVPDVVLADPRYIRQVLVDLLGNAVRFTQEGSIRLRIQASATYETLTFEVEDTGPGIPVADLERVFEPFVQLDDTTTRKNGGVGLSLTISRRIAERLGGTLRLESATGRGTRAVFCLPLELPDDVRWIAEWPLTADGEVRIEDVTLLVGSRILVVDDMPDNRKLFSRALERAGARVDTAPDGAVGVARIAEAGSDPYDLVVLDMQMPVMDGYEAARTLRHHGVSVPILAVTAHAIGDEAARCREAGCDAFLGKPLRPSRIIEESLRLLGGRVGTASD